MLSIRAFSALNYFKSSKAIKFLEAGGEDVREEDLTTLTLEIDFIRRELYEQIDMN